MADAPTILATRELSSIASSWTEYLCLKQIDEMNLLLFTGGYESLADLDDYYNDETDSHEIPDLIDGQPVVGIEDVYVVGGELQCTTESLVIDLEKYHHKDLADWLDATQWSKHVTPSEVEQRLKLVWRR